jgi:predicted dinucleotide-binding enzyme
MNIVIVGRGSVGGGLSRRWGRAGHTVAALGREGGDASGADVVVVAVPSDAIVDALDRVTGAAGKLTIDVTNAYRGRDDRFESLAHQVQSIVGGPTAKAFNTNPAALYDQIDDQREPPSDLYCSEEEAREVTEELSRDMGFDPVRVGGLDKARAQEDYFTDIWIGVVQTGLGPFFYRYARPGEL